MSRRGAAARAAESPAGAAAGNPAAGNPAAGNPAAGAWRDGAVPPDRSLRAILDADADGIVIVDAEGVVRFANPAAQQLLAHRPGGLVGTEFGFPLVAGQTTEVDLVRAAGEPAEPAEPTVAEVRVVELEWDGRTAYLASLRDITERKRAETERAQRLAAEAARAEAEAAVLARDEFFAVLAHEVKTPLTRLLLAVERTERELAGPGTPDREHLRRVMHLQRREAQKLSRVISDFFDMSLIQTNALRLHRAGVDVRTLVTRAVAAVSTGSAPHPVVVRLPETPVTALVDAERLAQVIAHLLDNAVRFSPNGEPIEVELSHVRAAAGGAAASSAAGEEDGDGRGTVRLTVSDHGVGVPPEHRPHIFDRFYQAHQRSYLSGIGVGLYVCRGIVELHGGQIEARFPDGGGSQFVVTLPDGG